LAKVTRLRPKRHDEIRERIQQALDLSLDLKQETRDDLANALGRYSPPEPWFFMQLNPDQHRLVMREIRNGPRPLTTVNVWLAAFTHMRVDTREVMAGRARLAADAQTSPAEVSRALVRLAEIGALIPLRRGRYAVNPHVGSCGALAKREAAAKKVPPLKLIKRDGAP
jgi:hypothetical protein